MISGEACTHMRSCLYELALLVLNSYFTAVFPPHPHQTPSQAQDRTGGSEERVLGITGALLGAWDQALPPHEFARLHIHLPVLFTPGCQVSVRIDCPKQGESYGGWPS